MNTKNRIKKVLTLAVVAMAIVLAGTHQVSAAVLTLGETVEVSSNNGVFQVSVYPGKASYAGLGGTVTGVFGNGTVADYRFFTANSDVMSTYVDGGAGIVAPVPSPPAGNVNGNQDWADVWTTSDPGVDFANAADFTDDTVARAQNLTGTIDISGIRVGTLYFIYGTYYNWNRVALTMSGAGQPDIQEEYYIDPPNDTNHGWITNFDFLHGGEYDTISYTYTNGDADASRARFMGVIVFADDPMQPSPADGEKVSASSTQVLSWTNLDPTTGSDVYVDVYFGTDANALGAFTTDPADGLNVTSVTVDASVIGQTYYWQVNSYINGSPTGDPNEGTLYTFYAADLPPSLVDAGVDMITWLGQGVQLGATVEDDGLSALTYLWTADPAAGVVFDSDSIANPIVTITGRSVVRGIQATNDDAEEHVNTQAISGAVPQGTMVLDSTDLELGSEGNGGLDWQVIAVQYNQLGIPQGSTITSAKLTFQVDNSGAAGTSNDFTILAEAADDASVFNTDLNNITDRARSAASVAWAPDWGTGPVVGTKVDTPDITTLIQEVVDRAGWSDNNRLTLMIYPDVYLASPTGGTTTVQEIEFEADPGSDSATLTVTYDPPAGSPPLSVPSIFTMTVEATDDVGSIADTMTIDVYDNACQMAKFGEGKIVATDFNGNCIAGLEDLVVMLGAWLDDYSATGPLDR